MENTDSIEKLADAWLAYESDGRDTQTRDQHFWAWQQVAWYMSNAPDAAWQFIQEVYRRSMSERQELMFACGPLEDFVHFHAVEYIDQIEALGKAEPKFAELLGGVWYRDTVPQSIWERIETLRGEPWGP